MAGYNGYSKSNNAIAAEWRGLLPASKLAQQIGRGATAEAVAKVMHFEEWHHTSKNYNKTYYYSVEADAARMLDIYGVDETPDALQRAEEWIVASVIHAAREMKNAAVDEFSATVTWLEWHGQGRRKRPVEHTVAAMVSKKKNCYTITTPDGKTFRKFEGTNGFRIERN